MATINDIETAALDAAKQVGINMIPETIKNIADFVGTYSPSIVTYVQLRLSGKITDDQFVSLFKGLLSVAEEHALVLAGHTEIEIDNAKNFILKAVTTIVLGAVGKITL